MKNKLVIGFFITLLLIGLLIYDDYGVSRDEPSQRELGYDYYRYVFEGNESLFDKPIKVYGPFIELNLIYIEKILGLTDSRDIYLMRHLMNFLLFYVSVIFFYKLISDWLNWKYALIGCLMLVLSPRIFANAFYNNKDLTFMSILIIGTYTLNQLRKKKNRKWVMIHGLVSACLIDTRIIGLILPLITVLLFKNKKELLIYCIITIAFTILFWPTLWKGPITEFINAFTKMSYYDDWVGTVKYLGKTYHGNDMPWHYIPAWIFMTMPLMYTLLFFFGLKPLIKKRKYTPLIIITLPIAMIYLFNSIIYNGWRHLYFIYPSIITAAVYGLRDLNKIKIKNLGLTINILLIISFLITGLTMINIHPNQQLYFNELINMEWAKDNLPLDYWTLTSRQGLEYIIANDERSIIKIDGHGLENLNILPKVDRERFIKGDIYDFSADYYLNNYEYFNIETIAPNYTINIKNVRVFELFTLPELNRTIQEALT